MAIRGFEKEGILAGKVGGENRRQREREREALWRLGSGVGEGLKRGFCGAAFQRGI